MRPTNLQSHLDKQIDSRIVYISFFVLADRRNNILIYYSIKHFSIKEKEKKKGDMSQHQKRNVMHQQTIS